MNGQFHAAVTLPLEKKSTDSHWIRRYMDPTDGTEETHFFSLLGIEPWTVQSTAQSPYRLISMNNGASGKIGRLHFVLELLTFCCWPVLNVKYRVYPSTGCIIVQSVSLYRVVSSCLPVPRGSSSVCRSGLIFCGLNATWMMDIVQDPVRTAQQTHSVSVTKTNQLMLYREIITVYSEIHTKHINTAVWAERRIGEC
jgi:hypothetical protein